MVIDKTTILEYKGIKFTHLVTEELQRLGEEVVRLDLGNIDWDYLDFFKSSTLDSFKADLSLEEVMEIMELGLETDEAYRICTALLDEAKRLGLWN